MYMSYYENQSEGHYKFYRIDPTIHVRMVDLKICYCIDKWHGRIGTEGKWMPYKFESIEQTKLGVESLHEDRLKYGYVELKECQTWEQLMGINPKSVQMGLGI